MVAVGIEPKTAKGHAAIMQIVYITTLGAALLGMPIATQALADAGHAHNAPHGETAYGKPGDPRKPTRIILVTMRDKDGAMSFIPNRFEVRRGEQIRFMLRNSGSVDHEFVLATAEENRKHMEEMMKNPDMEHDDPNAKRLKPGASGEIVWHFTRAGTFDIGCLIPGHSQAGMHATVIVK